MTALLFVSMMLQSPDAGQECSISGRISSASTGSPLKKARVRLVGTSVKTRLSGISTTTDTDGNFRFDNLAQDDYRLYGERDGYLAASGGHVSCGSSLSIKMMPQAMIFGRVVDNDGEPLANVQVATYKRTWIRGQRRFEIIQNTLSQADGSFVLGELNSGNYYLGAKGAGRLTQGENWIENFYPNTPDSESASPINIIAGTDLRGIELRVRSGRSYTVRGKATNLNGSPVNGVPLVLMRPGRGQISNAGTTAGAFEFHNVMPGTYLIRSIPIGNNGVSLSGQAAVAVGEQDILDLQVTLAAATEIPGVVKLGDAPFLEHFSVELEPVQGDGMNNNAQVKDGSFTFRNIGATLHHVRMNSLPDGYYVKSMRFAGRDLSRRELDLSSGSGGTLEIQLSSHPGEIAGIVRDSDGDPVEDAAVGVWAKDDPDIRTMRTDSRGHFSAGGLPPGEYKIAAWELNELGVVWNPQFRVSFDSQAMAVTTSENAQSSVDLKLIPKASVEAELAKLP